MSLDIELLEQARLLVVDASGDLVLHLTTVAGADYYFGVTLEGGQRVVSQWTRDIAQIRAAFTRGEEITGQHHDGAKGTQN